MLTHKGTKTLKTERLILRKFTVDDYKDMFNNWANDEAVTRFLTWAPHESMLATRQLLEGWCKAYERNDAYNWAMEFEGQIIGNISVVRLSEKSEYAELGYCMSRKHWNKGLMTEAARAVIGFLFSEVGVHRVTIAHAVKNPASGKVAQKCGLTYEGTKRECFKSSTGEFLDIAYYGILKHEWQVMTN
ncbi:MAG: GNAT family N-acetyltransferase [Clostridia bacterium]|nr:GNAT family N-acetyltransferase [Clostridia bacterium]